MKDEFSPKNTKHLRQKINEYFGSANKWFLKTPERALEQAYKAALTIKSIEDEYFDGNKISATSTNHSDNVMSYLQANLEKNLLIIKLKLAEFKVTDSVVGISNSLVLEKIRFIDDVIEKYRSKQSTSQSTSLALMPNSEIVKIDSNQVNTQPLYQVNSQPYLPVNVINNQPVSEKTGVLPRSIGRTINKIKTDLDPKSEAEVVQKFRNSRAKTRTAIRFLLILIIVPVLTQQVSKHFLVGPIVDRVRGENENTIFINSELREEAFAELQTYEEELKFSNLINIAPQLSPEVMEERVKLKATELVEEFRRKSSNAVSNVFADLVGLIAFSLVIFTGKREIIILKSFMDDVVYGLSDSAKAFIIILFTDIFVGFHSPHGWEVILEGLSTHLGLVANKSLISLFIATVPVIMDTIFKYWIFRYMSKLSPSAVATLKGMNE